MILTIREYRVVLYDHSQYNVRPLSIQLVKYYIQIILIRRNILPVSPNYCRILRIKFKFLIDKSLDSLHVYIHL